MSAEIEKAVAFDASYPCTRFGCSSCTEGIFLEAQRRNVLPAAVSRLCVGCIFRFGATRRGITGWKGRRTPSLGCRSRPGKPRAVRPGRRRGGVGRALRTAGRVRDARRPGPVERDGKVYARNQRVKPLKRYAGSNLADMGRSAVHARRWRATPGPGEVGRQGGHEEGCGVLVARPQGQSWAPTPSTGVW